MSDCGFDLLAVFLPPGKDANSKITLWHSSSSLSFPSFPPALPSLLRPPYLLHLQSFFLPVSPSELPSFFHPFHIYLTFPIFFFLLHVSLPLSSFVLLSFDPVCDLFCFLFPVSRLPHRIRTSSALFLGLSFLSFYSFLIHLSFCPFLTYFLSCLPLLPPTCPSVPPSLSLPDCPSSLPLIISVLPLLLLSVSCFCPSISSSPSFPYFFLSLPFLNPICSFLLRLPSLSLHFLPSVLVYFLPSFLLSSLCPTFPHILHLPSSPPTVKAALAASPLHYKSCDIETSGTILSFFFFFFSLPGTE